MNAQIKKLLTAAGVLLIPTMLLPGTATAGSNSGTSAAPLTGSSCDNRKTIDANFASWCTTPTAQIIKDKCVVVIHSSQIPNCGWQGCGFMSFVNERPTISGGMVNEYGISTPAGFTGTVPPSWEPAGSSVMPKAPYPRHYLTVTQFLSERAKCSALAPATLTQEISSGTVLGRICSLTQNTMNLNPYYFCMVNKQVIP